MPAKKSASKSPVSGGVAKAPAAAAVPAAAGNADASIKGSFTFVHCVS
jgi:hypothetical protein